MLDEPSLGLAPLVTREVFRVVADLNQKEGLAVLVVEQNAAIALASAPRAYVLETGSRREYRAAPTSYAERAVRARVPGVLMQTFFQRSSWARERARCTRRSRSRSCSSTARPR